MAEIGQGKEGVEQRGAGEGVLKGDQERDASGSEAMVRRVENRRQTGRQEE